MNTIYISPVLVYPVYRDTRVFLNVQRFMKPFLWKGKAFQVQRTGDPIGPSHPLDSIVLNYLLMDRCKKETNSFSNHVSH